MAKKKTTDELTLDLFGDVILSGEDEKEEEHQMPTKKRRFYHEAEEHMREFLPKRYKYLQESGKLEEYLQEPSPT